MLLKVKLLIAKPIYFILKQFYFNQYKHFINNHKSHKQLHIFDLDNTLAHTYPHLHRSDKLKMYEELPAHKPMVELANTTLKDRNSICLVLSARDYKYKNATRTWLNKNIVKKDMPFFLVPKAKDKLPYLNTALSNFETVFYYDDLSYNHEKGTVKFYHTVIEAVNNMPLTYFGYDAITKINEV